MESLTIDKINSILNELSYYHFCRKYKLIQSTSDRYWGIEEQGESGEEVSIFQIDKNIYVKTIRHSSSYGTPNDFFSSIQFVNPIKKEVIVYE